MSSFIDDLKMEGKEKQCFNFGFVNLNENDVFVLLDIDKEDYNRKYKRFYDLGNSYMKFELLKRFYEDSNRSIDDLKEYGNYRKIFNSDDKKNIGIDKGINTSELIQQLKNTSTN